MDLEFLTESSLPKGDTHVAVIIGRFNPPTIGHYKLIGEAIKGIKELNAKHKDAKLFNSPVVLVIGDDDKNAELIKQLADSKKKDKALEKLMRAPLCPSDIIYAMQNSGKLNIVPRNFFFSASTIPAGLDKLRAAGLEPIAVVSGGDRASKNEGEKSDYIRMLDNYFKNNDGSDIKHYEIIVNRAEDTNTSKEEKQKFINDMLSSAKSGSSTITATDASGSMARRAAELGYEEEFAKIVGLESKPALAKKIFNKIRKSIGVE